MSLLQQMSSPWGSQELLQGLISHELTAYLSIFNLFKPNELWPYYQKHVNQIILNRTTLWSLALQIFEAFIQILLIVNLSLNQTVLTFLLYARQTWMTQLILAISVWEFIRLVNKTHTIALVQAGMQALRQHNKFYWKSLRQKLIFWRLKRDLPLSFCVCHEKSKIIDWTKHSITTIYM